MKTTQEMIDVMQAFMEGKEIEHSCVNNSWHVVIEPTWNWDIYDYRIKPAEPKRVKLLAYVTKTGAFYHYVEGSQFSHAADNTTFFTRIPSLDLEYEVSE